MSLASSLPARFAIAGATSLTAVRPQQPGAQPAADMVLTNGTVLTVDANDSTAQAVAIAGGRIVAVGTSDAIKSRIGANTVVVDLHGRTATPGLIDTHVHFSEADEMFTIDLSDPAVKRIDDVLARVREEAAKLMPASGFAEAGGRSEAAERRYVTAADSRQGRARQPRLADADNRPLRRRQQLRAENRRR